LSQPATKAARSERLGCVCCRTSFEIHTGRDSPSYSAEEARSNLAALRRGHAARRSTNRSEGEASKSRVGIQMRRLPLPSTYRRILSVRLTPGLDLQTVQRLWIVRSETLCLPMIQ